MPIIMRLMVSFFFHGRVSIKSKKYIFENPNTNEYNWYSPKLIKNSFIVLKLKPFDESALPITNIAAPIIKLKMMAFLNFFMWL